MKCFVIVLTLWSAIAFVRTAPTEPVTTTAPSSAQKEKVQKALEECNATIPIPLERNPHDLVRISVLGGFTDITSNITRNEKCFLHCFLQKVGFLDENSDIKNGKDVLNYTIRQKSELAQYSDVLIAQLFQIARSSKVYDDKCFKAFVVYQQYVTSIFTLALAEGLNSNTGIKDKIVTSIQTGKPVEKEVEDEVKEILAFLDFILMAVAAHGVTSGL